MARIQTNAQHTTTPRPVFSPKVQHYGSKAWAPTTSPWPHSHYNKTLDRTPVKNL